MNYAPENEGHMLQVRSYVEHDPEPGYQHASLEAHEAFHDMKYGVRIHWGLYTLWKLRNESWKFLRMSRQRRQAYQQLYHQFNPQNFDADQWMDFFKRVGFKCFAITTKHHEGFSLFDTHTRVRSRVNWTVPGAPQIEDCNLAYSVMDTPFKRDIIAELCTAAHQHGVKIDLYFSHPDWYDADFRPYSFHPLQTQRVYDLPEEYGTREYVNLLKPPQHILSTEPTPQEVERMMARHRAQLVELLTHYGEIDMLCLDMWLGKPVWPELRETVRMLRKIQPDVMLRIRGIGNYGDYYTPEGVVPQDKAETSMPWMVIYPLGRTFSYEPLDRNHKGADWVIRNLIQCTATGGNFMVGIGPDADGRFHPKAIEVLETVGAWLQVNGEAVYATRPHTPWHEGEGVFFSRTKDNRSIYAFYCGDAWKEARQSGCLRLESVPVRQDLRVIPLCGVPLHGDESPHTPAVLEWNQEGRSLVVQLPAPVSAQMHRNSRFARVLKFTYSS